MREEVLVTVTINIPDAVPQMLHFLIIGNYGLKMTDSLAIHLYARVCPVFDRHDQVEGAVGKQVTVTKISMVDLRAVLRVRVIHPVVKRGATVTSGITEGPGEYFTAVKAFRIRWLGKRILDQNRKGQQHEEPLHLKVFETTRAKRVYCAGGNI
jgi:hypothetical protein